MQAREWSGIECLKVAYYSFSETLLRALRFFFADASFSLLLTQAPSKIRKKTFAYGFHESHAVYC